MMARRQQSQLITGIDIGSTAIRIAVGQATLNSQGSYDVHMIGAAEVAAEGIHKGVIASIEDTVSSLSGTLEQMERMVGIPIESAWVGISGMHIISQQSKGVVAVAKADGEIADEDVERAVEAARMVAPPLNYEMLHILPKAFTVDGQTGIKDPAGMTGIRLEVDTQIIHGLTAHIKNITKAVYRTGIDIDDLVLSSLATAQVVTTQRQRDLGVAVVNIGGTMSSVVVYEEGEVLHIATIPIGSEHVTNDLAIGLRTSIDVAERVKINHGMSLSKEISSREKIDLIHLGAEQSEKVSKRHIAEIIEARMAEIFEKVDEQLEIVQRSGLLPAGVVLTGGGSKLHGVMELARETLALPASLGYPIDIMSSTDKVNDLAFTTAIGLVQWGAGLQYTSGRSKSKLKVAGKAFGHVQSFLRSLIP